MNSLTHPSPPFLLITWIPGTVYKTRSEEDIYDAIRLPDFEEIKESKRKYAESFAIQYNSCALN